MCKTCDETNLYQQCVDNLTQVYNYDIDSIYETANCYATGCNHPHTNCK